MNFTSGWSKGKLKHYLYYRCTKHHSPNIPAQVIHEEWAQILQLLSFTDKQLEKVIGRSKEQLQQAKKKDLDSTSEKRLQLSELDQKMERLEEKMMNDEIDAPTYKKWYTKYSGEKAALLLEIKNLRSGDQATHNQLLKLLPSLTDIPAIFKMADIVDQHRMLREVFRHEIIYSEGHSRTLSINPAFSHNLLKFKHKGLLFLEQPSSKMGRVPIRTGNVEFLEHLSGFLGVLERILEKKRLQEEV